MGVGGECLQAGQTLQQFVGVSLQIILAKEPRNYVR